MNITSDKLNYQMNDMLEKAYSKFKESPALKTAELLLESAEHIKEYDIQLYVAILKEIIEPFCLKAMKNKSLSVEQKNDALRTFQNIIKLTARDSFDSFIVHLEYKRPFLERFYQFRRPILRPVVEKMQELYDGKLDLLILEMPPRVGKSTLGIWYLLWYMGHYPNGTSLMIGHTANLAKSFYTELLSVLSDSQTYAYYEVFPELTPRLKTYAKDLFIDISSASTINRRYKTFQCRGIDSALAGVTECNKLLYIDDLIDGIEEALSPLRLESKTMKLMNDVLQRKANSRVPMLVIGTAWSKGDPAEQLFNHYVDDPLFKVCRYKRPALDKNGNSNFNYNEKYGIGYTSEFYNKQSEMLDEVAFSCLYQQQRIDRDGMLFSMDKFPTYTQDFFKHIQSDKIHAYVDVAWGGGDFLAMPIIYEYKENFYLKDIVFSKDKKDITTLLLAKAIKRHQIYKVMVEKNNGGGEYAEELKRVLDRAHINCLIETKISPNTKDAKSVRILKYSKQIQNTHILKKEEQTREYKSAIMQICMFNEKQMHKHDDAVDALALIYRTIDKNNINTVYFGKRTW